MNVLERVREHAADIFQVPLNSLTPDSSPDTVDNWDSVNHMSFVMSLEQEFGLMFKPEEATMMANSLQAAAAVVESKL